MSQKIVMQKFGLHPFPLDFELSIKKNAQKNKSQNLKSRLAKIIRAGKPRYSNREFYANTNNFKSNWFCKTCLKFFYLTPKRKFKALLEYDLSSRNRRSQEIIHNDTLSAAINNKLPVAEIIELFKDSSFDLEFIVDSKTKYHSRMICNSPSKDNVLNNCVGILEEEPMPLSFTFSSY